MNYSVTGVARVVKLCEDVCYHGTFNCYGYHVTRLSSIYILVTVDSNPRNGRKVVASNTVCDYYMKVVRISVIKGIIIFNICYVMFITFNYNGIYNCPCYFFPIKLLYFNSFYYLLVFFIIIPHLNKNVFSRSGCSNSPNISIH